jgi:nitroimidazol reductase NimA-like FMN-containing flavoprotein (pyridoxamine 5'-phosphate oxidase superfamily)
VYDRDVVHAILDDGFLCHLGFVDEDQPVVIPTLYARVGDAVYIHGSSASRAIRHARGGAPVCLTVTHVDGLVLARSAFHHSVNYRSVVVFGRAEQVEGAAEKARALEAFMEAVMPGRWADARPPAPQELKATSVLRLPLDEASSKVRTGWPVDDEDDYERDVWAGVIPLELRRLAPEPDPRLGRGVPFPPYL